jgi:chromosome partitioning protein
VLESVILVINGKGGVGKTSLVANLAGLAAESGWRVLAIDVDPQGNLARDIGVLDRSDAGANLRDAATGRAGLTPLVDVRSRLDLVPGGDQLDALAAEIHATLARGQIAGGLGMLEGAIAPIAGRYDLIVIDSPPGDKSLQTAAARAARFLVVPTAPDDCSIDGLGAVFERWAHLRVDGGNPDLEILGVALTLTVARGDRIRRRARAVLAELLAGGVEVFETSIRFAQAAAVDCRRRGLLVHEYEQAALDAEPWYRNKQSVGESYSSATAGLAADYQSLTDEILHAYLARRGLAPVPVEVS